jgi:hypothetical protein
MIHHNVLQWWRLKILVRIIRLMLEIMMWVDVSMQNRRGGNYPVRERSPGNTVGAGGTTLELTSIVCG